MSVSTQIEKAKTILIFSGEGERGTFEKFNGKKTVRAIKSRLTKERCSGDRFATFYISADSSKYADDTYFEIDIDSGDALNMRTIEDKEWA